MGYQTFHKYNRLVRRGQADPLLCAVCKHEIVLKLGEGDDPLFDCVWCNTLTVPGQNTYDRVEETVRKYYGNSKN